MVNPLVKPLFENGLAGKDITFPAPVDVPHQFISNSKQDSGDFARSNDFSRSKRDQSD